MTHPTSQPGPNEYPQGTHPRCRRGRRGPLFILGVALLAGLAGAFASKAMSHGFPHHFGLKPAFMHTMGPMGFGAGPIDPSKIEARAERMAKHLGVEIDASKEQQDKLAVIAKSLAKDMIPLRQTMQSARKQGLELLGRESVDRAAIEALRTEQMATADVMSKRVSAAIADAAEVMTPEQRRKLAARIESWREHRWGFWRKG